MDSWINLVASVLTLTVAAIPAVAWAKRRLLLRATIRRLCEEFEEELRQGLPDGRGLLLGNEVEVARAMEGRQRARQAMRQRFAELASLLRPDNHVQAGLKEHLLKLLDAYECDARPEHYELSALKSRVDEVCGPPKEPAIPASV